MTWLIGRWVVIGSLAAALLAGVVLWGNHERKVGYERAQTEYRMQAIKTDRQRSSITEPLAAKQDAVQVKFRTITKTLIEKVPVYVKSNDCPMPGGFRVLHNAAANGELPRPAKIPDDPAVPAQAVTDTVITNYGIYFETAERLRGLQEWVAAQQSLKN